MSKAQDAVEALAEQAVGQYWDFLPTAGSRIGRHEYDGRLPDFSDGRIRRRVEELRQSLARLSALSDEADAAGQGNAVGRDNAVGRGDAPGRRDDDDDAGQARARLCRGLLEVFLRREAFSLGELRTLEDNPQRQVGHLNVGGYVQRDYAPLPERIRAATAALRQAPDFLAALDARTASELGAPVRNMAAAAYRGMAAFYRTALGDASGQCAVVAPQVAAEFDRARETAATAVDWFAERLQARPARPEFAIGAGRYQGMLASGEGVTTPLAELVSIGQANLEENLRRLEAAAQQVAPGRSAREVVAQLGAEHPAAAGLIPETRAMLEDIRQALVDYDIVGLPAAERCQVAETPPYMRYAFAAMDAPGALETAATEAYYYITPVEPHWTAAQQQQWLTNFNYHTLRVISIHEVYPGHYTHNLHNRYGGNRRSGGRGLPLISRVATSYAFTEGWAHYAEEMMLETGYGAGNPALRVAQLLEALVRNCRYLCSLGMHTQGMTLAEATEFFRAYAYMEEHPARQEALRGTFDPGYLNYTLGKLMLLKLRQDWRRQEGAAYTLRRFHDAALSWGAPPAPLLRQAMLTEGSEGVGAVL